MHFTPLEIPEVILIEPETMEDCRVEVMDVDFVLCDIHAAFVR